MNYKEKQYQEIFEDMLNDSLEKGLISHAEEFKDYINNNQDISNYYVMDKSVIALMMSRIYKHITAVYESAKVEYAEGEDLDAIGETIGIPRPQATHAEVQAVFTTTTILDENINIPAGITIATSSGIEYTTLEKISIPAGYTNTTVTARANRPGIESKIIENQITKILSNIRYSLKVTNPRTSKGGTPTYTDDEYRYLLMNWRKIDIKGSVEAYEYYFSTFDGIDSYKIIPNWDGTGTIKCIIDPGYPTQLEKAYNDLQNKITQATEDITLFKPTDRLIDIYATVNVDIDRINPYSENEKLEIQSRITEQIKVFIDGGYRSNNTYYPGLALGEDFIPHKLAVYLDKEVPELKNIDFKYPLEPITITDEEIGVSNNITIEMI